MADWSRDVGALPCEGDNGVDEEHSSCEVEVDGSTVPSCGVPCRMIFRHDEEPSASLDTYDAEVEEDTEAHLYLQYCMVQVRNEELGLVQCFLPFFQLRLFEIQQTNGKQMFRF